jgi:cellulose synthase/poly-beta-1,6-N-acetylglucosamine synthase-like glycosyltransferase
MTPMLSLSIIILQFTLGIATGIALLHLVVMLIVRKTKGELATKQPEQPLKYIFMVPALNEELVIEPSVRRLLAMPGDVEVLVINDGSVDRTGEIVAAMAAEDPRVRLLTRVAPNARQGKGKALNHAYRTIAAECAAAGIDPATVVICVMDADGLLDRHAIEAVNGLFGHDDLGAAQIGVRIVDRHPIRLRLQDIEFYTYTRVFQQGRNHLGSVGLGGNGQFTRLSALLDLGSDPWTECLTEDLDLGLQLTLKGWRLAFTDKAFGHQQGLMNISQLIRQRTRWVQGYFQCWKRIPQILTMPGHWWTVVDLLFVIMWPAVSCLFLPVAMVASWAVAGFALTQVELSASQWVVMAGLMYLFAFGTSILLGGAYARRSGDMSLWRTVMLIHTIWLFQFVWAAAAWKGIVRIVRRQGSWAKTARVAAPVVVAPQA